MLSHILIPSSRICIHQPFFGSFFVFYSKILWIWKQLNGWLAIPYGLANQKLYYLQMLLNLEKARKWDEDHSQKWWNLVPGMFFHFQDVVYPINLRKTDLMVTDPDGYTLVMLAVTTDRYGGFFYQSLGLY